MEDSALLATAAQGRWDSARAWAWYDRLPWLRGGNFNPASAVNQLEMWQAATFSPGDIDRELGWLADLGMNSMRVFLHDLLWRDDHASFLARLERFLEIAHARGIGTLFVFFDSCWHPYPQSGPQPAPRPGVHNSQWLQSPGLRVLRDESQWPRLEDYVSGVLDHFRDDARVHGWDLFNEPANPGMTVDEASKVPLEEKSKLALPLLVRVFQWARRVNPSQPLTSGIWTPEDWESPSPLAEFQLAASDVVSFHSYEPLPKTRERVERLRKLGRPLLCTEYLCRGAGNTFQTILPYFRAEKIAAYNWGGVSGKTQTRFPWDSCQNPYAAEPAVWHHEILHPDGTPYEAAETDLIRSLR